MYAVIQSGGKQYKVKKGDIVDVELLANEEGKSAVEFNEVLMISDGSNVKIGSPSLAQARVVGEFIGQVKGPKVVSFRYKQRKNQRRKVGHRQKYSRVKILDIVS